MIVLGGTLGAVLLQTPIAVFMRAMSIGRWIFFPPRIDLARGILMVTTWSNTARKEGLLGLEPVAETEPDPYARKGLQLLVDGAEPEVIRSILEVDLYTQEGRDLRAAKVYESMGGYSPTIGIIGAVMGLIHVMGNLPIPVSWAAASPWRSLPPSMASPLPTCWCCRSATSSRASSSGRRPTARCCWRGPVDRRG